LAVKAAAFIGRCPMDDALAGKLLGGVRHASPPRSSGRGKEHRFFAIRAGHTGTLPFALRRLRSSGPSCRACPGRHRGSRCGETTTGVARAAGRHGKQGRTVKSHRPHSARAVG
jgi:hypothetical protein